VIGKFISIEPLRIVYIKTGNPIPIHISKILDPYALEKESINLSFFASCNEKKVSGILEAIAAIIKAPINKLIPKISEIDSVANTSK
tara:strand:+ start:625 stop:885 length:261 start_codon:yes stop_codon:yes gene_type:complete